ncbi:MAG: hypothetical protein IH994_08540 [Proteobacteria bacterium]|nr:hypothetical protein [Pseudomonadota bacterium]
MKITRSLFCFNRPSVANDVSVAHKPPVVMICALQPGSSASAMAKPSGKKPSDLERGITTWADKGLAKYLEDSDLAAELVDWLHEETNLSKALLRLAVKILATLVSTVARKGGSWLGKIAAQRLETALESLPFYEKIIVALDKLTANLDRELAGKQEVKDILAGRRPPHDTEYAKTLTLELQMQIRQLQGLDELSNQVADGFLSIEGLLNPQPPLQLRMITETSENRFYFGAQKVPFVGRDDEISEVTGFLHGDGDFLWWLVAGPGGLGKSRLALEVCLRHGFAWRAGFFSPDDPFDDWGHWQPEQPTLLVADYASTQPKDLRGMVLALAQRNDLQFPVRMLLLERDAEGPWYSDFTGAGGDRHIIADASHGPAKALAPFGEDALWAILQSFLEGSPAKQPDRGKILTALKQIDPDARPLFASFLGDSLANGRDPRDWDRQRLIVDVLDREKKKHWEPAEVTEKDMHLLALATMTAGIDLEHLSGIEAANLIPDESGFSADRYRVISGRPATETLAALEPDILGELFVLEHLKPAHKADTTRAETLRIAAWNRNPFGMGAFLDRAAMDFPDHETLRLLHEVADSDKFQRSVWSMVAANLIGYYGNAGDIAAARALYDALEKLAAKHPEEPALREPQARGAALMQYLYEQNGDEGTCRRFEKKVKSDPELEAMVRALLDTLPPTEDGKGKE